MIRRSDAIQQRAFLLHPFGVVVDLASDAGHDLLLLLAGGVIETFRDLSVISTLALVMPQRSSSLLRASFLPLLREADPQRLMTHRRRLRR
jgi:hypothetical protein